MVGSLPFRLEGVWKEAFGGGGGKGSVSQTGRRPCSTPGEKALKKDEVFMVWYGMGSPSFRVFGWNTSPPPLVCIR